MHKFFILALALSFTFMSCSKEGPIGPEGPQGQQGVKGDKGDPGNAVVKVYTKNITDNEWVTVYTSGTNGYKKCEINAPNVLTSDVVDNWVILVYVYTSDNGGGGWFLTPYYTERNIVVTSEVSTKKILLKRHQDNKPGTQSWHKKVKVICIEPSSTGNLNRTMGPTIDYSDYHAVCEYYGIQE